MLCGVFTRSPRYPFNSVVCFSVCTLSGEPSLVQIFAYFSADCFGRVLRMMPLRIGHQTSRGISTTRGSDRNCFRYDFTALAVGAAGVPRLISRMPVLAIVPCWNLGSGRKDTGVRRQASGVGGEGR